MKLFSVLSSFVLLLPTGTDIHACASGPESEELRYMIFNPDLMHNRSWWSFFYNAKFTYMDGQIRPDDDERVLTDEWLKALKIDADPKVAFACLFGSLSDSALNQNTVYQAIQKQDAYRSYFELARQCENVSSSPDPWQSDESQEAAKVRDRSKLMNSLPVRITDEKNPFLKRKYAFQLAKLAYYAQDSPVFYEIYNRFFAHTDQDVLYWWATNYKSMVLEREEKLDSANYLHALVFSHCTGKMYVSRQYFSTKRLDAVLELAQNDNERADILVLAEVINPGRSLEGIRKINALQPDHRHLPLLTVREINKLEDWLGSPRYAETSKSVWMSGDDYSKPIDENWQRDFAYLQEVEQAIAGMNQLAVHVQYYLGLAYLNMLKGDAAAAADYLGRVRTTDPEVIYQIKAQETILLTLKEDVTSASTQEKIGDLLGELISTREQKFESEKLLYSLCSYLRYVYANKGSIVLAGLLDNLAVNKFCYTCQYYTFEYSMIRYFDRSASTADVIALIALYNKTDKNELEQLLMTPYSNPYYLYDLLATKYLREGDVKNAAATFQKIPDDFWYSFSNASENIDRDPFLENAELLTSATMATYNKREIAEKLIRLETEAESDPSKRAANYFLLGNAWYNFVDNSWFMLSYGRGGMDEDNFHRADAFALQRALGYYRKALDVTKDAEARVKILYMLVYLSERAQQKAYAREYEKYSETVFYNKRNCLTMSDLAGS